MVGEQVGFIPIHFIVVIEKPGIKVIERVPGLVGDDSIDLEPWKSTDASYRRARFDTSPSVAYGVVSRGCP